MKKRLIPLCTGIVLAFLGANLQSAPPVAGRASDIPAFYDGQMFTIQFVEFAPAAEQKLLQHNNGLNFIYQSDPGLPGGQRFISVIDAIPTDGFNPIWEEVQIAFKAGHTPRQLFSDDQVLMAAANGEITLTMTGEVYWCPIVGPGPNH